MNESLTFPAGVSSGELVWGGCGAGTFGMSFLVGVDGAIVGKFGNSGENGSPGGSREYII